MDPQHNAFPWTRYWVKRSGTLQLTSDGFLVEPGSADARRHSGLLTAEDVESTPCAALLGEPGIGKTTAINAMVEQQKDHPHIDVDLNAFASDDLLRRAIFEDDRLQEWAKQTQGRLTLYLDSLDESLVHIQTVAQLLLRELRRLPLDRLSLRIACRTAVWPEVLTKALRDLWPGGFEEFELAPLTRNNVRQAVELKGVDANAFLSEVRRLEMGPFASRPITFDFLLKEFASKKSLPSSASDLYESGCLRLASEQSPSRTHASGAHGKLSPHQRLHIASQLAAISLMSRRPTLVSTYTSTTDEEHCIDDIAAFLRDESGRGYARAEIVETLDTGLFSGRPNGRMGFAHRTFCEFLAARALTRLTDAQLSELLLRRGTDGRQRCLPQLREVAGWLLPTKPSLRDLLVADDPLVAMHGGLSSTDQATRRLATTSLLELAGAGRVVDADLALRSRYRLLRHDGIEDVLKPVILDRKGNVVQRRMAIDIAESCECTSLVPCLTEVAFDSTENTHIRGQAAGALAALANSEQRPSMRRLLGLTREEDPDDELHGHALTALYPSLMSAREVFERHLRPHHRDNFLGAYGAFVFNFPRSLSSAADLAAGLRWVAEQHRDHDENYSFLAVADEVLRRSWARTADDIVLDELAKTTLARLRRHDPVLPELARSDLNAPTPMESDVRGRRALIARSVCQAIADGLAVEGRSSVLGSLARTEDFEWHIDNSLHATTEAECAAWSELAVRSFDPGNPEQADRLILAARESERLRVLASYWLEPVQLDSERARALREEAQWNTPRQAPAKPPIDHQAIATRAIAQAESGDLDAWWHLNSSLLADDRTEYQFDLTLSHGWSRLDGATQQALVALGQRFLEASTPDEDEWLGQLVHYRPAAAGYRALRLLAGRGGSPITPELIGKWIVPVLALYENDESLPGAKALIRIACATAPKAVQEGLDRVLRFADSHTASVAFQKVEGFITADIAQDLLDRLEAGAFPDALTAEILVQLGALCPERIATHARAVAAARAAGTINPERDVAAFVAYLRVVPAADWGWALDSLRSDAPFAKAVVERVVRMAPSPGGDGASERSLADFYLLLRELFPGHMSLEAGYLSPRDEAHRFRDGLLHRLKAMGTLEAVAQVRRIAQSCPDAPWLSYEALEAEETWLKEAWAPLSPAELDRLLSESSSRYLATDDQLLDVVAESLGRLQELLQGETPAVVDLWNESPFMTPHDEGHLSDYIKRHLNVDLAGRRVAVNREVQLRSSDRTDIRVDAEGRDGKLSVILEVKGCWNPGLFTDMENQLLDRYLKNSGLRCGLYVVGWFYCEQWYEGDYRRRATPALTPRDAQANLDAEAIRLSGSGFRLLSVALDTRRPRGK